MNKINLVNQTMMPFCYYRARDIAEIAHVDIRTARKCLSRLVSGMAVNVEKRGSEKIYLTKQKQLF